MLIHNYINTSCELNMYYVIVYNIHMERITNKIEQNEQMY